MNDQLEQGISAYESGDQAAAFVFFREAVRLQPDSSAAWYWLSTVIDDPSRRRECLERSLQLEPSNQLALEALESLDLANPVMGGVLSGEKSSEQFERTLDSLEDANLPIQGEELTGTEEPLLTNTPEYSRLDPEIERQTRIEALAELEPQPLKAEKAMRQEVGQAPTHKRSIWVWIFGALIIMVLLVGGMALITYSNLPRYEALAPLLASVGPQAINPGAASTALDATALAALPSLTQQAPVFNQDQWNLQPVTYQKNDLGSGQSELIIDLVLENYSSYLGAVTIASEGILRTGDGQEFNIGFGYEPKLLIIPGIRLRSVDETHDLQVSLTLPTDTDDYRIYIPYKVEFLNLENLITGAGEGEFEIDAPQILLNQPSMFLTGGWQQFQEEPPPGVFAVEPGVAADFGLGKMTVEGLRKSGITAGTNAEYDLSLKATLINPSSEVTLTLNTRFPGFVMVYRDEQWGELIPPEVSIKSLSASPGRTTLADVWAVKAQEAPVEQPETWCSLGLYEAISGIQHKNFAVVSCLPMNPP
jgi:hypothetical protein